MNVTAFIARRIVFNRQKTFSGFIIKLAATATALSVAAMIITICFVNGFQQTISNKVFSFWGHLHAQRYEVNRSSVAEESAIEKNDTVLKLIKQQPQVQHVQAFATKSAVISFKQNIEGILFKGVDETFDVNYFKQFIVKGSWIDYNDPLYAHAIVVSEFTAKQLQLNINDTLSMNFISQEQEKSGFTKVAVKGIYKTGIEEFDKLYALGDLRLVQRFNNWQANEIGGYEIFIKDKDAIDKVDEAINDVLPDKWMARSIKNIHPNIFDWLGIQDMNRNVIFVVMALVALINMVTCLLILVMERTKMIGILKATGANDNFISAIFHYYSGFIALAGVGAGLIIGVGICLLQQYTGFIKLDESAYYVSRAPVIIMWWQVAAVTVTALAVCLLALRLPLLIVNTIKPVKAIQFS